MHAAFSPVSACKLHTHAKFLKNINVVFDYLTDEKRLTLNRTICKLMTCFTTACNLGKKTTYTHTHTDEDMG
jgi:hypothetical protein